NDNTTHGGKTQSKHRYHYTPKDSNNTDEYVKINQITPNSFNLNLIVKVVELKMLMKDSKDQMTVAEAVVGDETGCIVISIRNDQIEHFKQNSTLQIKKGRIELYKHNMRLRVDRFGSITPIEVTLTDNMVLTFSQTNLNGFLQTLTIM
ncbi:hypothetical protein AKO1_007216, partial [Acrasis kona]